MDADAWDERYAAEPLVWSSGPNQFVEAELRDLPPGRALDLACGEGRNAIWLASLGWSVTAVDFSSVAIEKARSRSSEQARAAVEWVVADVLAFEGSGFDLALLAYLQLPEDERRTAVRRAWESLVPGGHLFVVAHDSTNLTEGTGGPQDASVLYTAEDVMGDVAAGRVVRAERVAREVSPGEVAYDSLVHLVRQLDEPASSRS
jgi:SAM-dependent methyltransferase